MMVIPPHKIASPAGTAFERLVEIMAILRSPKGCPWDVQQTPESLKPYLIEEAYEVLEALDRNDPPAIRDELGDLLLQIVFHARIFEERGFFSITDVSNAIADKLTRRHPHVFAGLKSGDEHMLAAQWESIKTEEHLANGKTRSLSDCIPKHLPALQTARKLGKKSKTAAEPWEYILQEVHQNLLNLTEELTRKSDNGIDQKLGTLLFNLVRLGHIFNVDSEEALRRFNNKQLEALSNDSRAAKPAD